jgi:hypothetical protein
MSQYDYIIEKYGRNILSKEPNCNFRRMSLLLKLCTFLGHFVNFMHEQRYIG